MLYVIAAQYGELVFERGGRQNVRLHSKLELIVHNTSGS